MPSITTTRQPRLSLLLRLAISVTVAWLVFGTAGLWLEQRQNQYETARALHDACNRYSDGPAPLRDRRECWPEFERNLKAVSEEQYALLLPNLGIVAIMAAAVWLAGGALWLVIRWILAGRPISSTGEQTTDRHAGFNTDQRLEMWKTETESARAGFQAVNTFASGALKAAMLINGGAAVAALAFAGHLFAAEHAPAGLAAKVVPSISLFALGTMSAAMATAATYFSQLFFSALPRRPWFQPAAEVSRGIAVLLVAFGYASFYFGLDRAVAALQ